MSGGSKPKPVAVKSLVAFAAKDGSLDRRFTPAPTGQEGIEGHKMVTGRRPSTYQTEVSLSAEHKGFIFRGRADGYDAVNNCIEEIKTFYGDVSRIPTNHRQLHWAQAKCYGWMLCAKSGTQSVNIALIYFDLIDQKEYRFEEVWSAPALESYFKELAEKYCQWQKVVNQRLGQLDLWIKQLQFPYDTMHHSQRVMAEAVYKAASSRKILLAEAPTGTGKTLAALFPAIKAMSKTPVNKIFYLTAKTTGKQLALENISLIIGDSETPLRVLELTAQEKSCLSLDKQCNGDSCIYAKNFYTKLASARLAAYHYPVLDKASLETLAKEFAICPHYLSMEMSKWVDVVIADVNYYFDGTPLLLMLTQEFDWKPYLLVDESHNLIDRGRRMYSAQLNRSDLLRVKKIAPPNIKKPLTDINTAWVNLIKGLTQQELVLFTALTEKFHLALTTFANRYIEFLQREPDHPVQHTDAQQFFFDVINFQKVFDAIESDYCIDMQHLHTKAEVLTLRNLIPARLLSQRTAYAHCACFFSATLHPANYYRSLLGLPEDSIHIKVPSPFTTDQLNVNLASNLSTRFKDRSAAISPICNLICHQITEQKGNAIAFFPSYEFLQRAEQTLKELLGNTAIQVVVQSRRMTEKDRQGFITKFSNHTNLLGLAVLGGAFSEGIDLSGDTLKGVFIATLGLPQINPINEHLRHVLQTQFQQGYEFTYIYPGIQKIIQAAGRVIRTPTDTGYIWLLDERFQRPHIRSLLPDWWHVQPKRISLENKKPPKHLGTSEV